MLKENAHWKRAILGMNGSSTPSIISGRSGGGVITSFAPCILLTLTSGIALFIGIIVKLNVFALLGLVSLKEFRDLLLGLNKKLGQGVGYVLVPIIVERGGHADVADTSSTPDSVNVFVDTAVIRVGHVIIDDMHDILDVQTASGDAGGYQNRCLASLEGASVDRKQV
jgi:hypothetical protein